MVDEGEAVERGHAGGAALPHHLFGAREVAVAGERVHLVGEDGRAGGLEGAEEAELVLHQRHPAARLHQHPAGAGGGGGKQRRDVGLAAQELGVLVQVAGPGPGLPVLQHLAAVAPELLRVQPVVAHRGRVGGVDALRLGQQGGGGGHRLAGGEVGLEHLEHLPQVGELHEHAVQPHLAEVLLVAQRVADGEVAAEVPERRVRPVLLHQLRELLEVVARVAVQAGDHHHVAQRRQPEELLQPVLRPQVVDPVAVLAEGVPEDGEAHRMGVAADAAEEDGVADALLHVPVADGSGSAARSSD